MHASGMVAPHLNSLTALDEQTVVVPGAEAAVLPPTKTMAS